MSRRMRQTLHVISASLLLATSPCHAIVSSTSDSLLSGSGVDFLDGVAKLTLTRDDGTYLCSGSLLAGGAYILTAAHCVSGSEGANTTSLVSIALDSGSVTATSSTYYVAPGWDGELDEGNDLALIELSTAITSVEGYELYSGLANNETVLLAGYGKTGTGLAGATGSVGTLYYGYNEYDANGQFYNSIGVDGSLIYVYDFDDGTRRNNRFGSNGLGADEEAIIASGDSGGASLIQIDGEWYLVGVHSFGSCLRPGCTADSGFGDYAGDVAVYGQLSWMQTYVVSAVPEPSSYAMYLAGLGLLGGLSRLRAPVKPARH